MKRTLQRCPTMAAITATLRPRRDLVWEYLMMADDRTYNTK